MAVDITTIGIEMDTTSVKAGTADLNKAAIAGQKMADSLDKSADKVVKAGAKQEQAYKEVAREAAAAARKQEQEAERAARKIQEEADRAARSAQNQSRSVMQNLGWQTQDAIVQLQMGTSAATVFSQQGSMLASAWNPMLGLFVAVAGVVGGALYSSFSSASDISEELAEKIRELNKEYTTLGESQRKFLVDEEIKKQKQLREEAEKYRKEIEDLNAELSRRITRGTSGQMNGQSLDTEEVRNRIMQQNLELTQQITAAEGALETQNQLLAKSKEEVKRINGEQVEGDKVKLTTAQELIKSLEDEKAALELSGAAMADYIAKKAQATGADYEKIKSLYLEIEALELKKQQEKEGKQEAEKALRIEEQRAKSINDSINNLEKQNELYTSLNGVQSKYSDVLYQIESGLIKVTDAEKTRYLAAATANDQLAANKRLAEGIDDFSKKTEEDKKNLDKLIESVDDFGGAWSSTGSIIVDTFGTIGDHLDDYVNRIEEISKKEAKLAEEKAKFFGDPRELAKIAGAEKKLADERTKANVSSYRSIAGAASQMFDEQSKERKALHQMEQVFAAAEIALALQKSGANALTAITSAFAAPFPINFASGAAMIAIMAGLGVFSGGGGGGSGPSAADIQKVQGTGTVLGSDEKSMSISASFSAYEDIALEQLAELRGIRDAVTGLNTGIALLARDFVSGQRFTGAEVKGLGTTQAFSVGDFAGKEVYDFLNPFGADILDRGLKDLFGSTKKSLKDSGLLFNDQELGDILAGNFDAYFYNTIETTKKKLFGLSKKTSTKDELTGLDAGFEAQIQGIFGYIGAAVGGSIESLGIESANALEDFKLNIGKVSFKDLSGEEIQAELEAIFSQQADLIAGFVAPALAEYQKMGEGLFETLTRVAAEMATFNYYTDAMGLSFNATGLSAIAVQQNIAELSGGMDKLTENMQTYYEEFFTEEERAANQMKLLSAEMKNLGYDIVPSSREGFRNLVEAIDLTTEAGQKQFAGLMSLSEVFADLIPATESLVEAQRSAKDIAQERANLERQLLQLQGDTAALRAQDLSAIDASNQALQLQIWALQDQAAATREAETAARALEQAQKSIASERYNLETQLLQAQGNATALRARELEKIDESNRAIQLQIWALEDEKAAAELAAQERQAAADAMRQQEDENKRHADEMARIAEEAQKAQEKALEDARRAAEEQRKLAQGVHDSISDALRSLMGESEEYNQMSMAQARNTLQSALGVAKSGGSLVGFAGLEDALAAVQKVDASKYASAFEYNMARGQSIGLLSQLEKFTRVDGSHAGGLDYVPFDGYVAQLHKGERVMTASENKGQGELIAEIRALRNDLKDGDNATNGKMLSLLRIVERWDGDGLPLERVS